MKTFESMGKRDILKYLVHGYDFDYAVKQAKVSHHHRLDPAIDRAANDISWFCELHQEAVEKMANFGSEWFRPNQISDRPEVIRDLLALKLIECESRPSELPQGKNGATICWYRKSLEYLK